MERSFLNKFISGLILVIFLAIIIGITIQGIIKWREWREEKSKAAKEWSQALEELREAQSKPPIVDTHSVQPSISASMRPSVTPSVTPSVIPSVIPS